MATSERRPDDRDRGHTGDPGSFIGSQPERVEEAIPGGLGPSDERASAVATQSGAASPDIGQPDGHREGQPADDDTVREAGQNR
jgi:hypothetical protein